MIYKLKPLKYQVEQRQASKEYRPAENSNRN